MATDTTEKRRQGNLRITIAGGDKRMITLAELFAQRGVKCQMLGFDSYPDKTNEFQFTKDMEVAVGNTDVVILPFPCQKDGFLNTPFSSRRIELNSLFELGKETLFLGGRLPREGENFIDYSAQEDFLLRNAVPTAEGALALAMQMLSTTLWGSEITLLGYGRIGSYLANLLRSLGAKVTVVARNAKSRTLAEISGVCAVDFCDCASPLSCADIVFNTVPSRVLGEKELSAMAEGTIIIDLASLPGGVDEKDCADHKILLVRAMGLPGKVAPKTAGKAVFETVLRLLSERGIFI